MMFIDAAKSVDTACWSLDSGLLGGDWRWPESGDGHVMLLLDGVRVRDLVFQLRDWTGGRYRGDPLYAGTPFATVLHLSPWLIDLSGPNDPVLQRFLERGLDAEWGYLLISREGPLAVAQHLRSLLQVHTPEQGSMLLRVADPAVIGALLSSRRSVIDAPWGPIERLVVPDGVTGQWHTWSPADDGDHRSSLPIPSGGHRLDATVLRRLQECDRRTNLRHLACYVADNCPDWLVGMTRAECHAQLDALTQEAAALGMVSARQWRRLCLLMARLQQTSLAAETFPADIHAILSDPQRGDGTARLKAALALINSGGVPSGEPDGSETFEIHGRNGVPHGNGKAETDQVALDEFLRGFAPTNPASGHTT